MERDLPDVGPVPDEDPAAGGELEAFLAGDGPAGGGVCAAPTLLPSRKAWLILAAIFITIAVAVLYVYQAGDRKTVLGNQPIPADQYFTALQPAALHVPAGGGRLNRQPAEVEGAPAAPATQPVAAQSSIVQCPRCHTRGLPLCGSCGAVMQPIGGGLYACPVCGAVGLPVCPHCGAHMVSAAGAGRGAAVQAAAVDTGGQFRCPICGATGLPNWDAAGTPTCPRCGARMQVLGAAGGGPGQVPGR